MKIILNIAILVFILCSCSSINSIKNKNLPHIVLDTDNDKYGLIIKKTFYKLYKKIDNKNRTVTVRTGLTFNIHDTLSIKGKSKLKKLKGILSYKITDSSDTQVVKVGTIRNSINYGNITSLYGIDTSLKFAKERISRQLAQKLYNIIIIRVKNIDN